LRAHVERRGSPGRCTNLRRLRPCRDLTRPNRDDPTARVINFFQQYLNWPVRLEHHPSALAPPCDWVLLEHVRQKPWVYMSQQRISSGRNRGRDGVTQPT